MIKEGDILIAIDECRMSETSICALIIGKEYVVKHISDGFLFVNSEFKENHAFPIVKHQHDWTKFFKN